MCKRSSIRPLTALGVFSILLGLLMSVAGARAHALLVRSLPEAGAELTSAPATIELWFSEPLEPAFSTAYLVDAQGNKLGSGTATVDGTDPMHLTLPLMELPPGIYTVVYRNLSQADGHEWVGSFPLTLLNPDGTRPTGVQADVQGNSLPTPLKTVSRWLALVGAMCLAGMIAFQQIAIGVWQAAKQGPLPAPGEAGLIATIKHTVRVGLVVGIGAVFIGSWLQVMAQMASLGGGGAGGGAALDLFFRTRTGTLLFSRQLLVGVLLFVIVVAAGLPARLRSAGQWVALLLSFAVLVTFSVGSHAAAVTGSAWAIVGDFIHLGAAAVWLGGLLLLAVVLWQQRTQPATADAMLLLRQVARRFSAVATLAVFVLVCTGLFSSLVQLQTLAALWNTIYGQVLVVKVVLVVLALGVALLNHRLVRAQPDPITTATWTETNYRAFLWQVGGETLIGLVLMVVVAVLVQTPVPPLPAAPPTAARFFETILTADDLTIHLQISPHQVGANRYITHLYHADGSAIGEVQLVRLTFVHQTADLGQATLALKTLGDGMFAAEGAYQNRVGSWDVSLYVRRRGMDDVLTKTTVDVPAPGGVTNIERNPWQNPIATLPVGVVVGGVVVALLLMPLLWRRFLHNHD